MGKGVFYARVTQFSCNAKRIAALHLRSTVPLFPSVLSSLSIPYNRYQCEHSQLCFTSSVNSAYPVRESEDRVANTQEV